MLEVKMEFYTHYTVTIQLNGKLPIGSWIYSSPAIGNDGTIYFGCEDKNSLH